MEKRRNAPKIRFDGFFDDWEQRKLGKVADIIGGGTPSTSNEDYWDGDIDWYSPVEIGEQTYVENSQKKITELGLQKSSARILPVGTVLFTSRAGIGNTAILAKEGTTNQGFQSIVPHKDELDSYFIYSRTHELKRYGEKNGAGSTFAEVSGKQMSKMPILIPNLEEQVKIGTFFAHLDHTLALHQGKLDKLRHLKKAFLQLMFPQNGETEPRLRFANFFSAWEQRELGAIYSKIRNAFVGTATPYYVESGDKGYFYLESNNVKDGQINHNTEVFINEEFYLKQKDKWLKAGDLVMVQSGHVGHTAVIPEYLNNSAAHALIMFQEPKVEINPYFVNYELQTRPARKKLDNITAGNTIKHILASEMKEFPVILPKKAEQDKISEFLLGIDTTITLHQTKLEKLQSLKKAYLQKMFI